MMMRPTTSSPIGSDTSPFWLVFYNPIGPEFERLPADWTAEAHLSLRREKLPLNEGLKYKSQRQIGKASQMERTEKVDRNTIYGLK